MSANAAEPLPGTAAIRLRTRHEDFTSPNVIGRLPGSDPRLATENVVYTAHLDHVGIGEPIDGDAIYNGAVDNASGVAAVLAIARAFTELPERPRRSTLFVATTAEEPGLVGSDYLANHLPAGLHDLVAAINIDGATLMTHPLKAVTGMGAVHSSLSESLSDAAAHLDLTVRPEPIPLLGSDHYHFVLRGIPALWVIADAETGDPNLDGRALNRNWMDTRLHTPQDDMNQPLDFGAAALLARLMFLTGYEIATQSARPAWNEGDFIGETFSP
jgi:Zn-dependent M28 family amino/carboxypeptidase